MSLETKTKTKMKSSISQLKLFKACRRAYYFKYHEKLEPIQKADALQTGLSYHERIEEIYDGTYQMQLGDYSKERAMAEAYYKYIYPQIPWVKTEQWVSKPDGLHEMIGRVDGVAENGYLVEHKTTSAEITEAYEYDLQWDEQILAYMYMTGARKMYYTVCRKPTIRQKQNESEEEFFNRMVEWYDTDTDSKIRLLIVERTDQEVEEFAKDFRAMCDMMQMSTNYYRNTQHCNKWGRRCEYASICLNYDPDQVYTGFTKG